MVSEEIANKENGIPGFIKSKLAKMQKTCSAVNPHEKGDLDRSIFHARCVDLLKGCFAKRKDFDECLSSKSKELKLNS